MKESNQLSPDQIDQLFAFCRSKYVRYIDLQYEIVDHLASAIEEEMSEDNSLTFKAALNRVYGRFPITGFTKLIEQKEIAMYRYWRKRIFAYCKEYFTLPKLLLTVLFFSLCISMLWAFNGAGLLVIGGSLLLYSLVSFVRLNRLWKNQEKDKYLVISSFRSITGGVGSSVFLFCIQQKDLLSIINWQMSNISIGLISLLFTIFFIWTHASFTAFPKMIKDELNHKYAHLGLVLID